MSSSDKLKLKSDDKCDSTRVKRQCKLHSLLFSFSQFLRPNGMSRVDR